MDTRARTIGTITKYPLGHSPYRTLQEPRRGSTYVRSTLHHVSSFAFITWSLTVVQQVCAALSCSEKQCLFGFSMCCVVLCLSLLSKVSSHWQKWMNESFGMKNKPTTRRSWQSLWTDHLRLLNPFTSHESKHWFASETMMSWWEKNEIGPTEEFAAKIRARLDWDGVESEILLTQTIESSPWIIAPTHFRVSVDSSLFTRVPGAWLTIITALETCALLDLSIIIQAKVHSQPKVSVMSDEAGQKNGFEISNKFHLIVLFSFYKYK